MLPFLVNAKIDRSVIPDSSSTPRLDANQSREKIVSQYKVVRTSLIDNETTPLQVGNGDFAFGVDNTGMQTFLPFNTMSSWAWHNDSLPTNG